MADLTQTVEQVSDLAARLQGGSGGGALSAGSLLGNMSTTGLAISIVAGLVGSGYFMYGRKAGNMKAIVSGAALCIVPCFIGNTVVLAISCLLMAALPFLL